MQVLQNMENPRHYGSITCLCVDRKRSWILVGTSTGVLTLWDRRFGLLLKSWHVGIASIGRSVRIHQCVVHPSKGRGKWVMVTVDAQKREGPTSTHLVEVWDIEKSVLVETFVTRRATSGEPLLEPHELIGVDASVLPSSAIATLVRERQSEDGSHAAARTQLLPSPSPTVRTLAVGVDFGGHSLAHRSDMLEYGSEQQSSTRGVGRGGFMLTGSEDWKIRLWDLGRPERSSILSGPEGDHEKPAYA